MPQLYRGMSGRPNLNVLSSKAEPGAPYLEEMWERRSVGCPIHAAALSRHEWETTNLNVLSSKAERLWGPRTTDRPWGGEAGGSRRICIVAPGYESPLSHYTLPMALRLYAATSSPGKLRDFRTAAQTHSLNIEPLPNLEAIAAPEETGLTFAENATLKAVYYSQLAPGELVSRRRLRP